MGARVVGYGVGRIESGTPGLSCQAAWLVGMMIYCWG